MRVLIHDFAGHPFQMQLSRKLAERHQSVVHAYPVGLAGPKGRLTLNASDPTSLSVEAIRLSSQFNKYSPHRRFITQRKYARDLKRLIARLQPDVVLSANTPIDIQAELLWYCRQKNIGFVHWVQDVYCEAIAYFVRRKLKFGHRQVSTPFRVIERAVANRSNHAIVISPAFQSLLTAWGVPSSKISVIENWAPLDEIPPVPKHNEWRKSLGLGDKTLFLYSGTLGLKHRPDLLYALAKQLGPSCHVVVLSEGIGRDYLDSQPQLPNLTTLGFQPYDRLPEVLAAADVLVATLETDAGRFSVPSKILTYLCAGRPILLGGPQENLAASVLRRSSAGIVVDPEDMTAWIAEANRLAADSLYREDLARNARAYAETTFDIDQIAARFESILSAAASNRTPTAAERLARSFSNH